MGKQSVRIAGFERHRKKHAACQIKLFSMIQKPSSFNSMLFEVFFSNLVCNYFFGLGTLFYKFWRFENLGFFFRSTAYWRAAVFLFMSVADDAVADFAPTCVPFALDVFFCHHWPSYYHFSKSEQKIKWFLLMPWALGVEILNSRMRLAQGLFLQDDGCVEVRWARIAWCPPRRQHPPHRKILFGKKIAWRHPFFRSILNLNCQMSWMEDFGIPMRLV